MILICWHGLPSCVVGSRDIISTNHIEYGHRAQLEGDLQARLVLVKVRWHSFDSGGCCDKRDP